MLNKKYIHLILTDIRFWILIFFVIRLIGITNAPLEVGHNWRQCLTNMIARNFLEGNNNILYPQIDMAGEKNGIIGSEFPFFNYIIYLISKIFGYSHWYGRLINLIVSSFGVYFFYLLSENLYNKRIAFNSGIILIVSIWFGYSRKIMPDTFSVSLTIIGLYFCYRYLIEGSLINVILFFLFTSLGILCKIPALSLMSILIILLFIKSIPLKRKLAIGIFTILSFSLIYLWYFFWVPYLLNTYHYQLYFPKDIIEGLKEIATLIPETLEKFYFSSLQSYIAFLCFLTGLVLIAKSKDILLKTGIVLFFLAFIFFIIKTGAVFPLHGYYIIPFTPLMAFITGYMLSKINIKYQYILLLIIAIEGILNQQHDFFIKESEKYKLSLENIANKTTNKNDLIVINGGQNPQQLYFTNRKGWTINDTDLMDKEKILSLKNKGASYLFVNKNSFNENLESFSPIYQDQYYNVYKLE